MELCALAAAASVTLRGLEAVLYGSYVAYRDIFSVKTGEKPTTTVTSEILIDCK
jgi:hypothetical protein